MKKVSFSGYFVDLPTNAIYRYGVHSVELKIDKGTIITYDLIANKFIVHQAEFSKFEFSIAIEDMLWRE